LSRPLGDPLQNRPQKGWPAISTAWKRGSARTPTSMSASPGSVTVLPRRSWCCRSVANAHRSDAARKRLAVDLVAITNEIPRDWVPAEGLADLPSDPFGSRMRSDGEPQDAPSIVSED
jgi:hypothetical protein